MNLHTRLPKPNQEAEHCSQALKQLLIQQIQQQDALSFADFMQMALYTPQLGYYANGLTKFGSEGDFVTAPEISNLFSHCLAIQVKEIAEQLVHADIFELGAGSGRMAADILLELQRLDSLPQHYYILEPSAFLQQKQKETIQQIAPDCVARVIWLTQLPEKFSGVILANEVIDAMPVHLFRIANQQLLERCISLENNDLVWKDVVIKNKALNDEVFSIKNQYLNACKDYYSEINLIAKPWLGSLSDCLQQGAIILIDYGFPAHEYYHPERNTGTLMCHYRHHVHADPFFYPGLQDITAHVNFTQLAHGALEFKLEVLSYTTQAAFLLGLGIMERAAAIENEAERMYANQAMKRLIQPHEMGELFKVIMLGRGIKRNLKGLSLHDLRHKL